MNIKCCSIFLLFMILYSVSSQENTEKNSNKILHVAIIGAGAAGLTAARYCTDAAINYKCEIFEQMNEIGGTWIYTNQTGLDEFGIPIHTSMYKDLIANLPKELMEFPDYPFPNYAKSFLTQKQVLKYLHDYAKHYNVEKYIKFRHQVKQINPLPNNRWSITVTDLAKKANFTKEYDAVIICNGHYSKPIIPEIEGQDTFEGIKIHSHDYRMSEIFQDKRVLVIGAGPSGIDITVRLAKFTSKIFWSHRRKEIRWPFESNVILKPRIVSFSQKAAFFEDGTSEEIDAIVYCTGYEYSFPFLSKECGISVENKHVSPLYKHVVNIEKPSMAFIGLVFAVIPFPCFDFQIRMFMKHLHGDITLPSREQMHLDTNEEMNLRTAKGYPENYAHKLGYDFQGIYFNDLARIAQIEPFPPVKLKIYADTSMKPNRDVLYKIIDDENFNKTQLV